MFKFTYGVFIALIFFSVEARSQQVESIHVHLYTDSLKKGTFNYINIDGLLSNGRYIPLDSNDISFTASCGKFSGNNLWIEPNRQEEKVTIQAVLKKDNSLKKEFVLFIKKKDEAVPLKTGQQVLDEMRSGKKKKG